MRFSVARARGSALGSRLLSSSACGPRKASDSHAWYGQSTLVMILRHAGSGKRWDL